MRFSDLDPTICAAPGRRYGGRWGARGGHRCQTGQRRHWESLYTWQCSRQTTDGHQNGTGGVATGGDTTGAAVSQHRGKTTPVLCHAQDSSRGGERLGLRDSLECQIECFIYSFTL